MKSTHLLLLTVLVVIATVGVNADYDDYRYMAVCDNRCEIKNRMNPFAQGCDNCCQMHGFRKGKCKGFGWSYCMCKPHGQIRQLFNSILNGGVNQGYQQGYQHG